MSNHSSKANEKISPTTKKKKSFTHYNKSGP
jgi:hypothetical protein